MTTDTGRQAGRAGQAGTQRFAERTANGRTRFRSQLGLNWSHVGIGTYLGAADDATDAMVSDAVKASILGGINVVDTAANYRGGRGERAVGTALRDVFRSGTASRDEIIVASKAGYLPDGANAFRERYVGKDGITEADLVGGNHCMHPAYISDRIERSRDALGVECIDVFYVHNPEAQLQRIERPLFDARLQAAFEVLEAAVKDGRIGCYGLATWSAFRAWPGEKDHLSMVGAKAIAQRAAGGTDDNFQVVQLPFSVAMTEAYTKPTQWIGDVSVSALAAAGLLRIAAVGSGSIAKAKFPAMSPQIQDWVGAG
ncbi:MAG: aldo/keto reductase, partial [Proteobacteria bacterium]|nr:aldo/keto reductase [Pseudomonadota bacterium]